MGPRGSVWAPLGGISPAGSVVSRGSSRWSRGFGECIFVSQWQSIARTDLGYSALDMEVCTTLGMLSPEQAIQLKAAGLTAYNHNLDTSREFYPKVRLTIVLHRMLN
jgi:hypothetical protein